LVYPVARGTGPMLSSLGAFIFLRETPTAHGIAGLLAVVTGIGLISTQGDLSAFRRPGSQGGVRWGIATGSLIATTSRPGERLEQVAKRADMKMLEEKRLYYLQTNRDRRGTGAA
jgi:drug/metabolite transporter (DMT)-like permease